MLQQTQVSTVIPYWERWMKRFPTIQSLAQARETSVIKLWEGLGYYSRARNLHQAAKRIQEEYQGTLPGSKEALLALPGIGDYTSGAIASIAFNRPEPAIDGNVERLYARLFRIAETPKSKKASAFIRHHVKEAQGWASTQPSRACRSLTEALMELGAEICTPYRPKCGACPLQQACLAYLHDDVAAFPKKPAKKKQVKRTILAYLVDNGEALLCRLAPEGKPNAGLWELPQLETKAKTLNYRATLLALFPAANQPRCRYFSEVKHAITNSAIRTLGILVSPSIREPSEDYQYLSYRELRLRTFNAAHRKIIDNYLRDQSVY